MKEAKKIRAFQTLMLLALALFLSVMPPQASAQVGGGPYLGEILAVPYNFAPHGYALCAGQIMSISQNTALFSLLGTTYGGDGRVTFALPDLRGRSAISSGQGAGLTVRDLGEMDGEEQVTLTVSQMPSHTHSVQGSSVVGTSVTPDGNVWATQSRLKIFSAAANTLMSPGATSISGGSQPHDNRSPYTVLNYVIALQGIFPPRS